MLGAVALVCVLPAAQHKRLMPVTPEGMGLTWLSRTRTLSGRSIGRELRTGMPIADALDAWKLASCMRASRRLASCRFARANVAPRRSAKPEYNYIRCVCMRVDVPARCRLAPWNTTAVKSAPTKHAPVRLAL